MEPLHSLFLSSCVDVFPFPSIGNEINGFLKKINSNEMAREGGNIYGGNLRLWDVGGDVGGFEG